MTSWLRIEFKTSHRTYVTSELDEASLNYLLTNKQQEDWDKIASVKCKEELTTLLAWQGNVFWNRGDFDLGEGWLLGGGRTMAHKSSWG
jgi:hypothetical protein